MQPFKDPPALTGVVAEAILGIDTLWGGDVRSASGLGRTIADSWFSDEPLPAAYTHPSAAAVRQSGGVSAQKPDRKAIDTYLEAVDVPGAIAAVVREAKAMGGLRGAHLDGLALSLEVMWELASEILGRGPAVPYERCVLASTGATPRPSDPTEKRQRVAEILGAAGYLSSSRADVLAAVDAWRADRKVPTKSIAALGAAFVAQFDALAVQNVLPHLSPELVSVPRANAAFLPIENAWFSGSMNYLGRARRADGSPEYEATYELNAALEISVPEFQQLVSHEVVPGHVTTFAYLQNAYVRRLVGFEATVPTMNTRAGTLFEGIANHALLMAYGVKEPRELPDRDLELGVMLALLQDDGKNQASYLTWQEKLPQAEVARVLREEYLQSRERADKLSGAWGRHPLFGRMSLPAYRAGTEAVGALRRRYPPERLYPVLFACEGVVDIVTVQQAMAAKE